jgi:hypothetical protein
MSATTGPRRRSSCTSIVSTGTSPPQDGASTTRAWVRCGSKGVSLPPSTPPAGATPNPEALYNRGDKKRTHHNLDLRLCDLLSPSTAAPAFFPSVTLDLGAGPQEFVDGGVTAHNNPALQRLLTATIPEYSMDWAYGRNKLLLISVGTGFAPARLLNFTRLRRHIIYAECTLA